MIPDYLVEQLDRYQTEFFIYPWNLFELRLQEEMIRSDRSGSPFCYVEMNFSHWNRAWTQATDARHFSALLFQALANTARGSDFKGYLEHDKGLGLVFLDSGLKAWQQFYQRLHALMEQQAPELVPQLAEWESLLVRFEYPECVRQDSKGESP